MTMEPSLSSLTQELRQFVEEREWAQFHDPKNLAMAIASEAGELLAELRWVANEDADTFVRNPEYAARIADEVADVAIALILFCDCAGIDFFQAVNNKLNVNRRNYPVATSKGRSARP
jgi:dCTP diphosphatase